VGVNDKVCVPLMFFNKVCVPLMFAFDVFIPLMFPFDVPPFHFDVPLMLSINPEGFAICE
jgi:hypothetical protein